MAETLSYEPDFEDSADMKLLERRRSSMGLPPQREPARAILAEDGESIERFEVPKRGAVLLLDITAVPSDGVIPGAIVTLALSVTNDGDADAEETMVSVPLPGGVTYRPGSFVRDGHAQYDDVAESFFGSGLAIGTIAAKMRATFVWKLAVRLGQSPLLIAPTARAVNAAVAGGRQLRIGRKTSTGTSFASLQPLPKPFIPTELPVKVLPFYELDAEEELVHEAADAAISPMVAPRPEAPPRLALMLLGTLDRTTHAFFSGTFAAGKAPSLLQHCIFGAALTCAQRYEDGADAGGLGAHFAEQSRLLHRIVLHERMGKKEPITQYAGAFPDRLHELEPSEVPARPALSADGATLLLSVDVEAPARAVLARLLDERERWDFVKARQLALTLQAKSALGAGSDANLQTAADRALREYAQVSATILQRLFVRMRVDGTTAILFANEPQLDDAARALLAALAPLFA